MKEIRKLTYTQFVALQCEWLAEEAAHDTLTREDYGGAAVLVVRGQNQNQEAA